jgi:hypothetical protein
MTRKGYSLLLNVRSSQPSITAAHQDRHLQVDELPRRLGLLPAGCEAGAIGLVLPDEFQIGRR